MFEIIVYALLWASFGLVHSMTASDKFKVMLKPYLGSTYRLSYNLFASLHTVVVLMAGLWLLDYTRAEFASSWFFTLTTYLIMASGLIIVLLSLRQYDLGLFSGLTQISNTKQSGVREATEALNINGLNSLVRHPLYTGILIFVWGNATSAFGYWTALFASVYILIGAKFEERKLLALYGSAYRAYQSSVPMFMPRLL